jgi:hypothetical protein
MKESKWKARGEKRKVRSEKVRKAKSEVRHSAILYYGVHCHMWVALELHLSWCAFLRALNVKCKSKILESRTTSILSGLGRLPVRDSVEIKTLLVPTIYSGILI